MHSSRPESRAHPRHQLPASFQEVSSIFHFSQPGRWATEPQGVSMPPLTGVGSSVSTEVTRPSKTPPGLHHLGWGGRLLTSPLLWLLPPYDTVLAVGIESLKPHPTPPHPRQDGRYINKTEAGMWRNDPCALLVGIQNRAAAVENSTEGSQKVKHTITT